MTTQAENIRKDHQAFKEAKREGWALAPIRVWGAQEYILLGDIDLKTEAQKLDVVYITELSIARFAGCWPEVNSWDWDKNVPIRNYALVAFGPEGGAFVMGESAYANNSISVLTAVLPIRVTPGTPEDARQVRADLYRPSSTI